MRQQIDVILTLDASCSLKAADIAQGIKSRLSNLWAKPDFEIMKVDYKEEGEIYSDEPGDKAKDLKLEARYRKAARKHHRDGELEIDDMAVVSMGADPGAYVQAWIWIPKSEIKGVK